MYPSNISNFEKSYKLRIKLDRTNNYTYTQTICNFGPWFQKYKAKGTTGSEHVSNFISHPNITYTLNVKKLASEYKQQELSTNFDPTEFRIYIETNEYGGFYSIINHKMFSDNNNNNNNNTGKYGTNTERRNKISIDDKFVDLLNGENIGLIPFKFISPQGGYILVDVATNGFEMYISLTPVSISNDIYDLHIFLHRGISSPFIFPDQMPSKWRFLVFFLFVFLLFLVLNNSRWS
ncbi:uncharacterized protein SCDLUD_001083 [Saccharomycodes ludwigii]|uniref:uncharacterized protein n=1 Tax=Saccharomycodes ludwigii TaxID=36035 RepID=UPI001E86C59D|nr:hypothetical protein SCDLUD_001083 [Saccharomycodes ludwigii]KAH3903443.1 hypothetical protein SCDLUD_001083 [Saccharomycodes ludwigii]